MKRLRKPLPAPEPEEIPVEEVGYARVSTEDQSADMQIAAFKRRGIPDNNIYVDYASGSSMQRRNLQRALKLMAGRAGWTLVVWKLDRLGRDTFGLLELQKQFDAEGWNLVSLTESIDTKSPMGRAFFGMMGIMAQLERELIAERTKAGLARRKEQGVQLGRRTELTAAQFREIEARLLAEPKNGGRREPIASIAKSIKVRGKSISAPTVNFWFPGWRSKTKAERAAFRKTRPFPEA